MCNFLVEEFRVKSSVTHTISERRTVLRCMAALTETGLEYSSSDSHIFSGCSLDVA